MGLYSRFIFGDKGVEKEAKAGNLKLIKEKKILREKIDIPVGNVKAFDISKIKYKLKTEPNTVFFWSGCRKEIDGVIVDGDKVADNTTP